MYAVEKNQDVHEEAKRDEGWVVVLFRTLLPCQNPAGFSRVLQLVPHTRGKGRPGQALFVSQSSFRRETDPARDCRKDRRQHLENHPRLERIKNDQFQLKGVFKEAYEMMLLFGSPGAKQNVSTT